ncbi:MAG: hypothetical protein OEW13_10955, partial [Nitrospira sp.]|nr:hypothetical protein [Nitrospira sp.]
PLNLHTLQMMLQSGVVRRADCNPPGVNHARLNMAEDVERDSTNDIGTEQGWLARVMLGRKPKSQVSKRSQIR